MGKAGFFISLRGHPGTGSLVSGCHGTTTQVGTQDEGAQVPYFNGSSHPPAFHSPKRKVSCPL